MDAKTELLDRLQYLDSAIRSESVVDEGIVMSEHNGAARLLRRGLGIVAFNILEDFIKNRAFETLNDLSDIGLSFGLLPDSLQDSSTLGALKALVYRATLDKKEGNDWKLLIQDEALKIYSTKNSSYEFSKYSLVSSGPNVASSEVADLIKAFGISGGWGRIKMVSNAIGGGLPDLSQSYKNLADRRHRSAHQASFDYSYRWLQEVKNEIIAIASSIDILLSARCRQTRDDASIHMNKHEISNALGYRFIEFDEGVFRETKEIGGRARKIWTDLESALNAIRPRLVSNKEFLIILNDSRRIENWYIH